MGRPMAPNSSKFIKLRLFMSGTRSEAAAAATTWSAALPLNILNPGAGAAKASTDELPHMPLFTDEICTCTPSQTFNSPFTIITVPMPGAAVGTSLGPNQTTRTPNQPSQCPTQQGTHPSITQATQQARDGGGGDLGGDSGQSRGSCSGGGHG